MHMYMYVLTKLGSLDDARPCVALCVRAINSNTATAHSIPYCLRCSAFSLFFVLPPLLFVLPPQHLVPAQEPIMHLYFNHAKCTYTSEEDEVEGHEWWTTSYPYRQPIGLSASTAEIAVCSSAMRPSAMRLSMANELFTPPEWGGSFSWSWAASNAL